MTRFVHSGPTGETTSVQMVVNPDHSIMQENLYWLVISDLVNLLSHRAVALKFLREPALVELWLELITYFQGMNLFISFYLFIYLFWYLPKFTKRKKERPFPFFSYSVG
jgi:hypothetical protein